MERKAKRSATAGKFSRVRECPRCGLVFISNAVLGAIGFSLFLVAIHRGIAGKLTSGLKDGHSLQPDITSPSHEGLAVIGVAMPQHYTQGYGLQQVC